MRVEFVSSRALPDGRWETDGVLVAMPFTRPAEARRTAQLMARRAGADGLLLGVYDEGLGSESGLASPAAQAGPAGFVALVNAMFRCSASPWFCYVAQDAFPGRLWLSSALAALQKQNGVLASFNDGKWNGQLAAFGLARRDWVTRLYDGDFFYPGYEQHYADAELTVLALQEKGLAYAPESVLVEVDWDKDGKPVNSHDRALYLSRVQSGFDGRVTQRGLLERFR